MELQPLQNNGRDTTYTKYNNIRFNPNILDDQVHDDSPDLTTDEEFSTTAYAWLQCKRLCYGIIYAIPCVIFTVLFEIDKLNHAGVSVQLPPLPYPEMARVFIGNWADGYAHGSWHGVIILIVWNLHFLKRLIQVLFSPAYGNHLRSQYYAIPRWWEVLISLFYYVFFTTWIAYTTSYSFYVMARLAPSVYVIIVGSFLFILGELATTVAHFVIGRLGRKNRNQELNYAKPTITVLYLRGFCLGEMCTWFGFALISFTWAPLTFAFIQSLRVVMFGIVLSKTSNQNKYLAMLFV